VSTVYGYTVSHIYLFIYFVAGRLARSTLLVDFPGLSQLQVPIAPASAHVEAQMSAPLTDTIMWGVVSGVLRGIIGTPLDAWAIHAIVRNELSSLRSLTEMYKSGSFFRGLLPNTIRTTIRSPVHYASLEAGSALYSSGVPNSIRSRYPVFRGVFVGLAAALAESIVNTPLRVAQTLAVNGDTLRNALRADGVKILGRGFDGTLAHRLLSGAVFYGTYEQALSLGVPVSAAALLAGTAQVTLSSPFFALAIHKQKLNKRMSGNLFSLAMSIARERGVLAGLVRPGLVPRLLHSWLVSPIIMWIIDVKLRAIRRS
jgi:hypothetical protein